ncbi:MAG TPA: ATP-binding cassette domain-containing protein [Patescibacteria group bacterium]|nr:ATP-binding cassette domain-containing protein [Patescibacteria group bacterium]
MLLSVNIDTKTMGSKQLMQGLNFVVEAGEKVAIIGRNGVGKTTLFHLLTGEDKDFYGEVQIRRGTRVVSTAQEHHAVGDQTVLDYILTNLPDYTKLKHIIDTYPDHMGDDLKKIEEYSSALEHFSSLGYYTVDDDIVRSLGDYQIKEELVLGPLQRLSGGQKRFVELVRIEYSDADIALIDEPTNHMDYIAKAAFVDWFKAVKHTVVVISHDRDVLGQVDRIIEMKDRKVSIYKGNYDAYLKQNATNTSAKMHDYEVGQRTLENLHKQIQSVRAKKASTNKTPNPFIPLERRLLKERDELEKSLQKPNFWIDRESADNLSKKAGDNYEKYKAKNIRVGKTTQTEGVRELLKIEDIQLSYGQAPLFQPIYFSLQHGDRLQLIGRNGVGKTTLVRAIIDAANGKRADTWRSGSIFTDSKLRLSVYEQEISSEVLKMTLEAAIEHIYAQLSQPVTGQTVMRLMGDYLFNPHEDGRLLVEQLSGGQKARLQIIKMLANNPNLLILDEPTNHLDLPSIEELENALSSYNGALLYISHDSYFAKNMGGEKIVLKA